MAQSIDRSKAGPSSLTGLVIRGQGAARPGSDDQQLEWPALLPLLRCPRCHAALTPTGDRLTCSAADCRRVFPIVNDVPVLINEDRSLFRLADYTQSVKAELATDPGLVHLMHARLPTLNVNIPAARNFRRLAELALRRSQRPIILVVGGGIYGEGMGVLTDYPTIQLIETDVHIGERTMLVCDAHDLPLATESVDAVIVQAVLEHVVDPHRCVAEIHRVLKPHGLVYAETPFMQQVHLGQFDFTRYTHLGHRRLFRWFDQVDSGAVGGPGMALAWAYEYFLLSFTTVRPLRIVLRGLARVTAFWLKYFDRYLVRTPGGLDAASGFFFLGAKSNQPLTDRDLIAQYQGALR